MCVHIMLVSVWSYQLLGTVTCSSDNRLIVQITCNLKEIESTHYCTCVCGSCLGRAGLYNCTVESSPDHCFRTSMSISFVSVLATER